MCEIDHGGLELEHAHPPGVHLLERHRLPRERCELLEQAATVQPAGLVIVERDARQHRTPIAHLGAARAQELDDRTVVEPDEHPTDVEHDMADRARRRRAAGGYGGHGAMLPVSPGRRLTATTVALGKKLNSEALAQV